jgi:hypothetical protein
MRHSSPLSVGLDAHEEAIAVASVAQAQDAEVLSLGSLGPRQADIDQRMRKRPATATPLVLVDDAGPWGYGLSR